MSTLYVWDPKRFDWYIPGTPSVYHENEYHYSSAFKFDNNVKRYLKLWGPGYSPKKVPFSSATPDELRKILNAYYVGQINLNSYFNVGDKRVFHLDEIPATDDTEGQPAQDIEFMIADIARDDLSSPTLFRRKAGLTLIAKQPLANQERFHKSNSNTVWRDSSIRSWANSSFINALGEWAPYVKQVSKQSSYDASRKYYVTTQDKVWLPSITELTNELDTHEKLQTQYLVYEQYPDERIVANTDGAELIPYDIRITDTNIDTYFTDVKQEGYGFSYDEESGRWINMNYHINSSYSQMSMTIVKPLQVNVDVWNESEGNYDMTTIYVNNVAVKGYGGTSSEVLPILLKEGDVLSIKYHKDGSVHSGIDGGRIGIIIPKQAVGCCSGYITRSNQSTLIRSIDSYTGDTYKFSIYSNDEADICFGFCL